MIVHSVTHAWGFYALSFDVFLPFFIHRVNKENAVCNFPSFPLTSMVQRTDAFKSPIPFPSTPLRYYLHLTPSKTTLSHTFILFYLPLLFLLDFLCLPLFYFPFPSDSRVGTYIRRSTYLWYSQCSGGSMLLNTFF